MISEQGRWIHNNISREFPFRLGLDMLKSSIGRGLLRNHMKNEKHVIFLSQKNKTKFATSIQ